MACRKAVHVFSLKNGEKDLPTQLIKIGIYKKVNSNIAGKS
jgi:hypothetical protein